MSAADKSKLDGVAANANNYIHPTSPAGAKSSGLYKIATDANGHVTGATAVTKTDITNLGIPAQDTNTTYSVATTSSNGLMSSATYRRLASFGSAYISRYNGNKELESTERYNTYEGMYHVNSHVSYCAHIEGYNNRCGINSTSIAPNYDIYEDPDIKHLTSCLHMEGANNFAKNNNALCHIEGYNNSVISGRCSSIRGSDNTVSGGSREHVLDVSGHNNTISGGCGYIGGSDNTVSGGVNQLVIGSNITVKSTDNSLIFGDTCSIPAGGYGCLVGGYKCSINSTSSVSGNVVLGYQCTTKGVASCAMGYNVNGVTCSLTVGSNNKMPEIESAHSTRPGFIVGNGSSSEDKYRSNSFRVTNSQIYGIASYTTGGADYAEYFEWKDGNLDNEDRRGYFVTLEGDKIKIANSEDDYILGVISGNSSVVGNADSDGWYHRYVRDEFNTFKLITNENDYQIYGIDKSIPLGAFIIDPKYNPEENYASRDNRPEWSIVGMLGQIPVRDDGTCQVNDYCTITNGGIATLASKSDRLKYRVLKRVTENVIQIIFK